MKVTVSENWGTKEWVWYATAALSVLLVTTAAGRAGAEEPVLFFQDQTDYYAYLDCNGHQIWAGPASSSDPEDGSWVKIACSDPEDHEYDIDADDDALTLRGPVRIPAGLGDDVRLAFKYQGYDADIWSVHELCVLRTADTAYPDQADCELLFEDFSGASPPDLPLGWEIQDGTSDQSSLDWETDGYLSAVHDYDGWNYVAQYLITPPFDTCLTECCSDSDCTRPASTCVGDTLREYTATCDAGVCDHGYEETDCAELAPPAADVCDGQDIIAYTGTGSCVVDECVLPTTITPCNEGCTVDLAGNGVCIDTSGTCRGALNMMYKATGAIGDAWTWTFGNEDWDFDGYGVDWSRSSSVGRTDSGSADFWLDNYRPDEDNRVELAHGYDLSACSSCSMNMEFWVKGESEDGYDYLYAECDDGSWTALEPGVDGTYPDWALETRALPPSCVGANFRAALRFQSDESVQRDGFYVDDLRVYPLGAPGQGAIDKLSSSRAVGWACHSGDYSAALDVRLTFSKGPGTAPLERVVRAGAPREKAVADQCGGVTDHGWTLDFDPELLSYLGNDPYTVAVTAIPPGVCGGPEYELLPEQIEVLFVANGHFPQEEDIQEHLEAIGKYALDVRPDYEISGSTDLLAYDLIIITEFAPGIPASGLQNIATAGVPTLIVEYWDFWYSYKLGLVTHEDCGYVGSATIEAYNEGVYDSFTSRVGSEPSVYQPHGTVYGVHTSQVEEGILPLFYSSKTFEEVGILLDLERNIAATGLYDTTKYTGDAWKLFDLLIAKLSPRPPERGSIQEVAQAYADSGLLTFLQRVETDLGRDPESWAFEAVELEAWRSNVEWNLGEMWDYIMDRIHKIYGRTYIPKGPTAIYEHPLRPTESELIADQGGIPDMEQERWFLGEYWESPSSVEPPPTWGAFHSGTDLGLGVSVELYNRQIFYMGDTFDSAFGPMWDTSKCDSSAYCNDMVVLSWDTSPGDGLDSGIDIYPVLVTTAAGYRWDPLTIQGVHRDFSTSFGTYWNMPPASPIPEPRFTVPSGAVTVDNVIPVFLGGDIYLIWGTPVVMSWYATAASPSMLDSSDIQSTPRSWAGCSLDGLNFHPCYSDLEAVPFSDYSEIPNSQNGKFINVAAIELTSADFNKLCSDPTSSPMCYFHEPSQPYYKQGGLLLYGSGRLFRMSGLYLAFIKRTDIGDLEAGRPKVSYWTGSGWSPNEADAISLTHEQGSLSCDVDSEKSQFQCYCSLITHGSDPAYDACDCTNPVYPECDIFTDEGHGLFGELSATLVRALAVSVDDQVFLMNKSAFNRNWAFVWKAPLSQPWGGKFESVSPFETKTSGYAPYIMDSFSDATWTSGEVVLWHTISTWRYGPYGVYTGWEVVPWY